MEKRVYQYTVTEAETKMIFIESETEEEAKEMARQLVRNPDNVHRVGRNIMHETIVELEAEECESTG